MTSSHRRAYVDWARGIAVLLMIEAHTLDAWTSLKPMVRRTIGFRDATVLGGFAAPMFLWLAGLAVVLAATRAAARSGSRRAAVAMICRRGLEIFVLAFLFRIQGFIVTPGASPVNLFRVDILNIMGPAIAAAGLVWGTTRTTSARVWAYAAIATAIAMTTPLVRAAAAIDAWPIWLQWQVRPFGDLTTFTFFPWAAFVFAGGAVGALIAAAREPREERRLHASLGACGAVLIVAGFYAAGRPSIYPSSSFWTSSPTWFAIRLGILMLALTAIYGCEYGIAALKGCATPKAKAGATPNAKAGAIPSAKAGVTPNAKAGEAAQGVSLEVEQGFPGAPKRSPREGGSPAIDPLAKLGRNSLFIYWIHVELVYGYASWLWRHRLPLWGTAIAFALFCVLMYRALGWRDEIVAKWRNRDAGATREAHAATA
jgi:uncharacterized membrane protein